MEKNQAVLCGVATSLSLGWALFNMFKTVLEFEAALLASFLAGLYISAPACLAYRWIGVKPRAVLISDFVLASLGSLCFFLSPPWALSLPMALACLAAPLLARERKREVSLLDELPGLWRRYAGVLTASRVSEELGLDLKEAEDLLEEGCRRLKARKVVREGCVIYVLPDVLSGLPGRQALIMEAFIQRPSGLTLHELSSLTGLKPRLLRPALADLVRSGVLVERGGEYKLVVVSGRQRHGRRRKKRRRRSRRFRRP